MSLLWLITKIIKTKYFGKGVRSYSCRCGSIMRKFNVIDHRLWIPLVGYVSLLQIPLCHILYGADKVKQGHSETQVWALNSCWRSVLTIRLLYRKVQNFKGTVKLLLWCYIFSDKENMTLWSLHDATTIRHIMKHKYYDLAS